MAVYFELVYGTTGSGYDFLNADLSGDPNTWQRTGNKDGTFTETFDLVSSSNSLTDSQIMACVQQLDELDEWARRYWSSDREDLPVWFVITSDTESIKQSLVSSIRIIPRSVGFFTPMLGEGLHYFTCQITHSAIWESYYSITKGATSLAMNGARMTLDTIAGSIPARIKSLKFQDPGSSSEIVDIWAGILPARYTTSNDFAYQTLYELEDSYTLLQAACGAEWWSPDYVYLAIGSAITPLTNAFDQNAGTGVAVTMQIGRYIYIGSSRPFSSIYIKLSAVNNNTATFYSATNGQSTTFYNRTRLYDSVTSGGTPFAGSGFISLELRNPGITPISINWQPITLQGYTGYWWRLAVNGTLDAITIDEIVCHASIPYPDNEAKGASPADGATDNVVLYNPWTTNVDFERIYYTKLRYLMTGDAPNYLYNSYIGRWLVLLRYRIKDIHADTEFRLRLKYGLHSTIGSNDLSAMSECEDIYIGYDTYGDENYHLVELGEISLPAMPHRGDTDHDYWYLRDYTLEIYGELTDETYGSYDELLLLDCLIFIPAEHIVVVKDAVGLNAGGMVNIGEMEDGTMQAIQRAAANEADPVNYAQVNAAIINLEYPIKGGGFIIAGQRSDNHVLSDTLAVSIEYYTRHKNFHDAST